jgi:hypothetical protein
MKEIWESVKGYEEFYEVSNLGRVRSFDRQSWSGKAFYLKKGRMLAAGCDSAGYPQVNLCINGSGQITRVHRLVAKAFISNPENKREVDHKDGNPSNNNVKNLRWFTHLENMNNPVAKARIGKAMKGKCAGVKNHWYGVHGANHFLSKPVLQFSKTGVFIKEHENAVEAGLKLGLDRTSIYKVCNNYKNHITAGGFKWEYA